MLEHVWVMFKDDPKWQVVSPISRSLKRTKNDESSAYTISSNTDTSVRVKEDEVKVHPIGQKKQKKRSSQGGRRKQRTMDKVPPVIWTQS